MNGYVKAANGLLSAADLNLATDVTGILPIANGGTGASAKNFVDLTTNQSVAGNKTLTGETTFSNRVTMTGMVNIDRPAGIVKTDSSGNIEVGTVNLPTEVVGSLPQNNGGNGNLIPTNASFELSPVNTGWTCSAIVPSASGAASVDGAQGITFTASSANQGCTRYVSMPEGNVGKLLEYSMYVKSTGGDVEVCSINDSVVSNCKTYTVGQSTDVVKVIVTDRPKNANTNANGILFRTKTATSTTFFGDLAYVGLPKSDEAIVAKFDNTTGWTPCTFSTLAWQGLGTVTGVEYLKCKRDKDELVIEGSLVSGTTTSAEIQIPLPINFGSISVNTTTTQTRGMWFRNLTSTSKGGTFLITAGSNLIKMSHSSTFGSDSINSLIPTNGLQIPTSTFFTITDLRIPIAEWSSQTNAAIVACKEGPLKCTNRFTFIYNGTNATDQFGNAYTVTKSEASNRAKEINVSSLGLTNGLRCVSSSGAGNANVGLTQTGIANTTTSVYVQTFTYSGSNVDYTFSIDCTKQGSDYNEAYERIVIQKDNADVRETEWLTGGFDYIDNKPIYKRCHMVAADISTDAATVASWGTGLNPIATNFGNSTNEFTVSNNSTSAGYYLLLYNKTTGNVRTALSGGYIVRAGTKFCMEYTR